MISDRKRTLPLLKSASVDPTDRTRRAVFAGHLKRTA